MADLEFLVLLGALYGLTHAVLWAIGRHADTP